MQIFISSQGNSKYTYYTLVHILLKSEVLVVFVRILAHTNTFTEYHNSHGIQSLHHLERIRSTHIAFYRLL